jgi:hypothetical protein
LRYAVSLGDRRRHAACTGFFMGPAREDASGSKDPAENARYGAEERAASERARLLSEAQALRERARQLTEQADALIERFRREFLKD